jgi:hypothetical protein
VVVVLAAVAPGGVDVEAPAVGDCGGLTVKPVLIRYCRWVEVLAKVTVAVPRSPGTVVRGAIVAPG